MCIIEPHQVTRNQKIMISLFLKKVSRCFILTTFSSIVSTSAYGSTIFGIPIDVEVFATDWLYLDISLAATLDALEQIGIESSPFELDYTSDYNIIENLGEFSGNTSASLNGIYSGGLLNINYNSSFFSSKDGNGEPTFTKTYESNGTGSYGKSGEIIRIKDSATLFKTKDGATLSFIIEIDRNNDGVFERKIEDIFKVTQFIRIDITIITGLSDSSGNLVRIVYNEDEKKGKSEYEFDPKSSRRSSIYNDCIVETGSGSGSTTCKVVSTPENSSNLALLALGTLGAASTLKRQLKPSKSTEKETTKVG